MFIISKILAVSACNCAEIEVNDSIQMHERIQSLAMSKRKKEIKKDHCIQLRKETSIHCVHLLKDVQAATACSCKDINVDSTELEERVQSLTTINCILKGTLKYPTV